MLQASIEKPIKLLRLLMASVKLPTEFVQSFLVRRTGYSFNLLIAIDLECFPEETKEALLEGNGKKSEEYIKSLPSFKDDYQTWYSESKALIKQLLPDRLSDFVRLYEKPKSRKDITYENYRIEDCLQGLNITRGWEKEKVVGPDAAIPLLHQQLAIVKAIKARFESSLFEIKQLVQADLFDSELDAAEELLKHNFLRAAGAVAGVVIEKHLSQICTNHNISIRKKNPTIADFNNKLKEAEVIELPQWRFIQHLADIRNLCDHNKKSEPTKNQIDDLIQGTMKIIKTIF